MDPAELLKWLIGGIKVAIAIDLAPGPLSWDAIRLRDGMKYEERGNFTSIENPTRSGSGSSTLNPIIVMRSPCQSLHVNPLRVLLLSKSLIQICPILPRIFT